ncbi:MAG TPA: glycine zipper domain-containing protein [Burkholderiales bacterium]|nr:glycine zipper domain-containing protein [Burkholderiales bacterium]
MGKSLIAVILACATTFGLSACASKGETVGTVGGAVAGGAIGSAATGGSAVGTLGGAAIGGAVGHEAGERYENRRR